MVNGEIDIRQRVVPSPESQDWNYHETQTSSPNRQVQTLEELVEISKTEAIINLQRWWKRRRDNNKRVDLLREQCRVHAVTLIRTQRNARVRAKIRELVLHVLFLYFYSVSSQYSYSHERLYRFTNAATSQFLEAKIPVSTSSLQKKFHDIATSEEFFRWMKGPFVLLCYPSQSNDTTIFQNNRVVGGIRVGQLRVKEKDCTKRITTYFNDSTDPISAMYCYDSNNGDFQMSDESNESFGGADGDKYVFDYKNNGTERAEFFSSMRSTSSSITFPAPAFSVILPRVNGTKALESLVSLEKDYIDKQTRVVMIDVNLYNIMLQYVLALRFVVEFPASGGAITMVSAESAPLSKSFITALSGDLWHTCCNVVVVLFYVYFLIIEILAHSRPQRKKVIIKTLRWSTRYGSAARMLSIVFYFLVWLMRLFALTNFPKDFPLTSESYVSLRPFTHAFRLSQYVLAVNTCLCWLILVLLLRVVQTVNLFVRTILIARTKLLTLLFCLSVLFYGYGGAFLIAFGEQSSQFRSIPTAMSTFMQGLFRIAPAGSVTGVLNAYGSSTTTMQMLLFACFLVLNVFIMASLFLVVLFEAYHKAQEELVMQQYKHSSQEPLNLVVEVMAYGKALYEASYGCLRVLCAKLPFIQKRPYSMVSKRLSRMFILPSSTMLQKSAKIISNQVDTLAGIGGKFVQQIVQDDEAENSKRRRSGEGDDGVGNVNGDPDLLRGRSKDVDSTLLQGMIMQLALQNETLMRTLDDMRQEMKVMVPRTILESPSSHQITQESPLSAPTRVRHQQQHSLRKHSNAELHRLRKEDTIRSIDMLETFVIE